MQARHYFGIGFDFKIVALLLALMLSGPIVTQAQFVTQDWKLHDVGQLTHIMTNRGNLNKEGTDYPGLLNTEYPPRSFVEHLGLTGWYIGGITPEGDTLVSVTHSFASADEFIGYSSQPWDTIWVAERGDTLDIPYIDKPYTPTSDQDFVTRYNDYNDAALQVATHEPLYLDVIQKSYAWASPPLDKMIMVNYEVVPQQFDIDSAYVTFIVDGNVGYRTGSGFTFANDDYAKYYENMNMAATFDSEGGEDGGLYSPIGTMVVPPADVDTSQLNWTFLWGDRQPVIPPQRDPERYAQMASGEILPDQVRPNQVHYILSFGPVNMTKGDTLSFRLGLIVGDDEEELLSNARTVQKLLPDFKVPAPPPQPPLHITTENRVVNLNWKAREGETNPETYDDPNRADSAETPFEGYRVYKSTESSDGPWTLLAEYDLAGNDFGLNSGLKYEFQDQALMNNVEYYYAVTAYSKPDTVINFPGRSSPLRGIQAVPGTAPPEDVGQVAVVPNPYRGDIDYNSSTPPWEKPPETRERWLEQDRRIQFINLPKDCTIKIFTVSGTLVQTLEHNDPTQGYEDWNLTSSVGQAVSSGIYLFTVENDNNGEVQVGKFVIIK